jgi:hypothetical protein
MTDARITDKTIPFVRSRLLKRLSRKKVTKATAPQADAPGANGAITST